MGPSSLGKILVFVGIGLVVVGFLFWGLSKIGSPIGKLPGDIKIQGEKFSFYFPIVTSIILSILLTLIINFIIWLMKK